MSDPLPFESATPRFALPMLFAGQAQKEFFVNEALLRADLLLHCAVEGRLASEPAAPSAGRAWLVGAPASGAFLGHEHEIAAWTEGGWRFFAPVDGLRVFDRSLGAFRVFITGAWDEPAPVAPPTGGATVDVEGRAALTRVIDKLVASGVLPAD